MTTINEMGKKVAKMIFTTSDPGSKKLYQMFSPGGRKRLPSNLKTSYRL